MKKLNRQLASSSGKHNEKLVSIKVSKADANPHLGDGERLTKILSSSQPESPRLLRVLEEGEVDQILPHSDAVVEVVRVTSKITGASLPFYLQTDRVVITSLLTRNSSE